jgi:hypothetical protein
MIKKKLFLIYFYVIFLLPMNLLVAEPTEAPITDNKAKCKAELTCAGGGKVSCEGTKVCRVDSWSVDCDGVKGYC